MKRGRLLGLRTNHRGLIVLCLCLLTLAIAVASQAAAQNGEQHTILVPSVFSSVVHREKGFVEYEELSINHLGSGQVDHWSVTVTSSENITITVAPAAVTNILLTVVDESDTRLVENYDNAPAGEVETIVGLPVDSAGPLEIQVFSNTPISSDYALMVMDESSYKFHFRGTLDPGAMESDALAEESDHFWFFSAAEGDSLSMQVTPNDSGDAYVELYGPGASRLLTIDNKGNGEAEVLDNYPIADTGMYSIRVGEFDFAAMNYSIVAVIE